jgi:hypothetical protein
LFDRLGSELKGVIVFVISIEWNDGSEHVTVKDTVNVFGTLAGRFVTCWKCWSVIEEQSAGR